MFIVTYRIAGAIFAVEFASAVRPRQRPPSQWYQVADTEADLSCRWRMIDAGSLTLPPLASGEIAAASHVVFGLPSGWDSPMWRSPAVRAWLQAALEAPESMRLVMRDGAVAVLDFGRAEVEYFTADPGDAVVVAGPGLWETGPFLPSFSSAVVHSLGVVRGGMGGLFLAADGGGKTTVAGHMPTGIVLSDDQVILRLQHDGLGAHSTPWGTLGMDPASAPLGAYFLLEQSDRFELTRVPATAVLEYLWQEGLIHYHMLPRQLKVQAFDLLWHMSRQAPAYRMRFAKDFVDWDAIDRVLLKQTA
jgi:hypothetical protein